MTRAWKVALIVVTMFTGRAWIPPRAKQ